MVAASPLDVAATVLLPETWCVARTAAGGRRTDLVRCCVVVSDRKSPARKRKGLITATCCRRSTTCYRRSAIVNHDLGWLWAFGTHILDHWSEDMTQARFHCMFGLNGLSP
ncbi:unnamed protein product [Lactuca virosa]|uniref:Secreted protein n=1 Tax=Lactuca virosa TaxID=75947 RepID=A0AAU9N255_9ASTR|nr:unnamed protein product [Lactuca virosa]